MANKELIVIEKAKDLGDYLFQVTNNSPKKFRFTFVSRMQNLALDLIENLYRANSVRVNEENKQAALKRRKAYQREAKVSLDVLCYMALISRKHQCILPKHYEQITLKAAEVERLLYGWARSDNKK